MNIAEFLEYRSNCPLCGDKLITFLHSQKQQSVKHEENRLVFQFRMDGLKKQDAHYKIGYSFGLKDNSWQMEAYQYDMRLDNYITNRVMERFKELDKNLGSYVFYRACTGPKCYCYNYKSNRFKLSYATGQIMNLTDRSAVLRVSTEYIGMCTPLDKGFKIYKLLNDYSGGKSNLVYGRHQDPCIARSDWGTNNPPIHELDLIQTAIIKFSTKQDTMERINKLLVFS